MLRKSREWSKSRLGEPSTWSAISAWLLVGGFSTFTFWPHWRWFIVAAAIAATIAAIKKEGAR